MSTLTLYEKTMINARAGKKGNLICNFKTIFKTIFDNDVEVCELRECPFDSSVYVVWWSDYFTTYEKYQVEGYFEEGSWEVVGNKCKRAIFKNKVKGE